MNLRDRDHLARTKCVAEPLESRLLFSNVTLITHGFASGYPSWVDDMAAGVGQSLGKTANPWDNVSLYHMVVKDQSGVAVTSFARVAGPSPAASLTGDIVITLDWSAVASISDIQSTTTVAAVVSSALLAQNADLGGAMVQSPVHLIGHSRGGSLVSVLASDLGQKGVWVDDVTTLDPHPVSQFGDYAALEPTDNVVFADNYWRSDASEFLIPDGQSVTGAANDPQTNGDAAKFESDLESGGGYSHDTNGGWDHSNVHLWYYGTVALSATQDPTDGAVIGPGYYGDPVPRSMTGFAYSQLAPASRPAGGVSALAGGAAARAHVAQVGPVFSDLGGVSLDAGGAGFVANGSAASISYRYQDVAGGASVSFFLDNDTNPYNSFTRAIGQDPSLPATGAAPNTAQRTLGVTWSSAGVQPGFYHVAARIVSAGGLTRYDYLPAPVYVMPAGVDVTLPTTPPSLTGTQIGDGTAQRSAFNHFTLNFDQPVSLSAGAVTMNQLTTDSTGAVLTSNAVAAPAFTLTNPTGDGKTWLVTVAPGGALDNGYGDFLDGIYRFTLHAAAVTNAYATTLTGGDVTQSFLKLYGDINGDGVVNPLDFGAFRNAYGSSAGDTNYNAALDIDHDGTIGPIDFGKFRGNYGKILYLPLA
jgi:hypothetical protein